MNYNWTTAAELDVVLTVFMVNLYLDGYDTGTGRTTAAALRFYLPALFVGRNVLPRTLRALDGWRKLVPPKMRLPLPKIAVGAVAGWLMFRRQLSMAAYVLVTFDAYLRPSEAYRLTGDSVVPPGSVAGPQQGLWGLIVNDSKEGVPGKTGISDHSVLIDSVELFGLLEALKMARPGRQVLWTFSPEEMRELFRVAVTELGLADEAPTLYTLRHGGASHDLLHGRRTLPEVKERGGWQTDASLRRYGKRTRLQERINAIPADVRCFGESVLAQVPVLLQLAAQGHPFPLTMPTTRQKPFPARKATPTLSHRWTFI